MSIEFNDKVAIVTGAASGLGFAAAQKLMSEGAKVMLSDINQEIIKFIYSDTTGESQTCFKNFQLFQ